MTIPHEETALQIAEAWHSVTDEWIVRRNKYETRQWEVVHTWHVDNLISENTMKVVACHTTKEKAEQTAKLCEDLARGAAVLAALEKLR